MEHPPTTELRFFAVRSRLHRSNFILFYINSRTCRNQNPQTNLRALI